MGKMKHTVMYFVSKLLVAKYSTKVLQFHVGSRNRAVSGWV